MRLRWSLVAFGLMGCNEQPAASPDYGAQGQARAEAARRQQAVAAQQAQQQAIADQQRRVAEAQAAWAAQGAAQQKAIDANAAAFTAKRDADRQALEKKCADTRVERAADASKRVKQWRDHLKKISPHLKEIAAKCTLKDTTGVRVEKVPDGNGTIVRTQKVGEPDALVCQGGKRPGNLTEDETKEALYLLNTEDWKTSSLPYGAYLETNTRCRELDGQVGLSTDAARGDDEAMRRIEAWTAPAPTP